MAMKRHIDNIMTRLGGAHAPSGSRRTSHDSDGRRASHDSGNGARGVALIITGLAALVIVLLLVLCRLDVNPLSLQPHAATELVEAEEDFVELFEPAPVRANPAPAYTPTPQRHRSDPAPATGADLKNSGKAGKAVPDVTSTRKSDLKRQPKETPPDPGPSKEELAREEARREARQGIADAFKPRDNAQDNTSAKGRDKGDSGNPQGSSSAADGHGSGSVDGGWIMPSYAKVPSALTGRIELRAEVGRDGHVTSVRQVGGKAPAGSDATLVARCIAEVKARRFTRNDDRAPERAVARIIYTFK